MGRRKKWKVDLLSGRTAGMLVLGVLFFGGSLVGCVCAGCIGDADEALIAYVRGYVVSLTQGQCSGHFLPVLWEISKVPVAVFVLGFTALGVVGLPILFALRGFLLSYAVCAFYRLLGVKGLLAAFVLFGFLALVWLPVLFHLGTHSLLGAQGLLRRTMGNGRFPLCYNGSYLIACGVCAVTLCLCAALECLVVPTLLQKIVWIFGSG